MLHIWSIWYVWQLDYENEEGPDYSDATNQKVVTKSTDLQDIAKEIGRRLGGANVVITKAKYHGMAEHHIETEDGE